MDEVIDDIISMQSNYDIQEFIGAVQMPNTVSESNAACFSSSVPDRKLAIGLQLPLYYPKKTSKKTLQSDMTEWDSSPFCSCC